MYQWHKDSKYSNRGNIRGGTSAAYIDKIYQFSSLNSTVTKIDISLNPVSGSVATQSKQKGIESDTLLLVSKFNVPLSISEGDIKTFIHAAMTTEQQTDLTLTGKTDIISTLDVAFYPIIADFDITTLAWASANALPLGTSLHTFHQRWNAGGYWIDVPSGNIEQRPDWQVSANTHYAFTYEADADATIYGLAYKSKPDYTLSNPAADGGVTGVGVTGKMTLTYVRGHGLTNHIGLIL